MSSGPTAVSWDFFSLRESTLLPMELEGIVVNKVNEAWQLSSDGLLSDMEKIISEMSTQVSELKRLRQTIDQLYKFKKCRNEEQHNINNNVLEDTEESLTPLMNKRRFFRSGWHSDY